MTTPENQEPEAVSNSSLLNEIIQASSKKSEITTNGENGGNAPQEPPQGEIRATPPQNIKKPQEPMSPGMVMKLLGSILFVSTIFFGSFLAYIVFNPDQAIFFMNVFNINRNDIANLLKILINGSFGVIMLITSIIWIISLFRAFWTPKDLKRKRLIAWLTTGIIGILLFSILTFWAYLFNKIDSIPWPNLMGSVLVYDNDLFTHDQVKGKAVINDTSNLIGPINLHFDIRDNAEQVAKKNLFQIESYEINFDGALCNDGKSIVTGSNPKNEQSIVCTFDQIKPYNIR